MTTTTRFRHLAVRESDRRGFALIAVIVAMVVLGLIGSAALSLTMGDQQVTRLFSDANQVDAASAAGLEHAVAVFQSDGAFPVNATINGYTYDVTKTVDLFDYNGDTVADTVFLASDGTLNEVVNGLHGTDIPVSVLPGGSTNVVARSLGIPNDVVDATEHLLSCADDFQPRAIDLGIANGRRFVFSNARHV